MADLLNAFVRALRDLKQPRVLAVLVLPMAAAVLLWSVLAFFFWDSWTAGFRSLIDGSAVARWIVARDAAWVLDSLGVLVVIALVVPAVVLTAVLITELAAMPVIVSVASNRYPELEKRQGGTIAGSVANAVFAILFFGVLWIGTLPLWLTGIGAVILPAANSAYLNQRLFRYDALSEHASRGEYLHIVSRNRARLFALGLLVAPLYYVPLLNLAAPTLAGLAFTHFCLAELAALRRGTADT